MMDPKVIDDHATKPATRRRPSLTNTFSPCAGIDSVTTVSRRTAGGRLGDITTAAREALSEVPKHDPWWEISGKDGRTILRTYEGQEPLEVEGK